MEEQGCTGICGGMYVLSWLDSELLRAQDREEAFTPVFSGFGLGLAQSWCVARVGQDSEGKERYVMRKEMREKEMR